MDRRVMLLLLLLALPAALPAASPARLRAMLASSDPHVRLQAVTVLTHQRVPHTRWRLAKLLGDEDPAIERAALHAYVFQGGSRIAALMQLMVDHPCTDYIKAARLRSDAKWALAHLRNPKLIPEMLDRIGLCYLSSGPEMYFNDDGSKDLRTSIVSMGATAIPALCRAMKEPDRFKRFIGVDIYTTLAGHDLGALLAIYNDTSFAFDDVRVALLTAIDATHDARGVDVVLIALDDPSDDVKTFAARLAAPWYAGPNKARLRRFAVEHSALAIPILRQMADAHDPDATRLLVSVLCQDNESSVTNAAYTLHDIYDNHEESFLQMAIDAGAPQMHLLKIYLNFWHGPNPVVPSPLPDDDLLPMFRQHQVAAPPRPAPAPDAFEQQYHWLARTDRRMDREYHADTLNERFIPYFRPMNF